MLKKKEEPPSEPIDIFGYKSRPHRKARAPNPPKKPNKSVRLSLIND